MKKYRVNVNGTVYEVELEDITGAAPASAPAAQASLPCISFGPLLLTFCILISHNLVFSKN